MNRPYGDCYEASLNSAEELLAIKSGVEDCASPDPILMKLYDGLGLDREISVVHGTVIPPKGIDKGRSIMHAWVEVGADTIESSNGQLKKNVLTDYYEHFNASVVRRYSVTEARALVNKHGRYGAWHTMGAMRPNQSIKRDAL